MSAGRAPGLPRRPAGTAEGDDTATPIPALCLIADRPTLGAAYILAALPEVLAAVATPVLIIDRDGRGPGEARERLAHLHALRAICAVHGALLVVSGRVDLALAAQAHGVHLPERGLPAGEVRGAWPELLVGRSCHDREGLLAAQAAGADYALLSPVAAPHSKPLAGRALGIDGFAGAVRGLALPVLALGGVGPALAGPLRASGAAGLATLGGVLGAAQPAREARRWVEAWRAGRS